MSGGKVVCSNWKLSEMSPTHVKGLEERPAADPWPPVLFPKRPNLETHFTRFPRM